MPSLHYSVLSSGSCGNSYVFYDERDTLIVDAGLTIKQQQDRMITASLPFDKICAVFITHLHPDHVKGAYKISDLTNKKVYLNSYSVKQDPLSFIKTNLRAEHCEYFNTGDQIKIQNYVITPFELSHDCKGTVGYYIHSLLTDKKITIITDTGYLTDISKEMAYKSDLLFIESNYDDEMLKNGPYKIPLQNRIKGECGHLSNIQCKEFLETFNNNDIKVHLIHISDNCNKKEIIENLYDDNFKNKFKEFNILKRGEFFKGEY